ncbi:MAG: methyltransferase domain-containing protein [Gammaproteobacteria bacterium]|jgi:SAM-dependent methyltransferase|nr:SAM-dependent methyltransferase [Dehalococcoidales bacterium]MDP6097829.1 methyltransferase domain-containing protein [Gammaproteobacteria bacterium]|tara:strand:+ start:608 stop:1387 length:780 start_codon:yes stop_codon:yes gene_type:complete
MTKPITDFYDRLSLEYRKNMGWDWEAGLRKEGVTLDKFLVSQLGRPGPYSLLDCSCGIGTQAIGLALQGHQVHATDLSPVSIDCARRESADFDVSMTFGVADFRELSATISDTFDVVISCDNSFAHCLRDDDLAAALVSIKTSLKVGGLMLLSVRDYEALVADKPRFNNEHVRDMSDGRRVAFQLWDWASDGRSYHNHQFLIKETDGEYDVKHFETKLRALLRDEVITAAKDAGYKEVSWHVPETSGYYQPIVTARNPG